MIWPSPPTPTTKSMSLYFKFNSLVTKPKAVVATQPKRHAFFNEDPFVILVTLFSDTIAYSLKVVTQPALIVLFFKKPFRALAFDY